MKVVVAPRAELEAAEAVRTYDELRPGLGKAFVEEFAAILKRLGVHPYIAQSVTGKFRRAVMHGFPFHVIYRVTPREVEVIGVLPTPADPEHLLARLLSSDTPH